MINKGTLTLDEERLNLLKTPRGGYTKPLAAALGLEWPLTKGWKSSLIAEGRQITEARFNILLGASQRKAVRKYTRSA